MQINKVLKRGGLAASNVNETLFTHSNDQLHQVLVMKYAGVIPALPIDLLKEVRRAEQVFNIKGSEQKQQKKAIVEKHIASPDPTTSLERQIKLVESQLERMESVRETPMSKINSKIPRENPHVQSQVYSSDNIPAPVLMQNQEMIE